MFDKKEMKLINFEKAKKYLMNGLHTGQAKKQISYREAKAIEMIFQKAFPDEAHSCSQFFHKGISKFWIEEVTNKAGKCTGCI